MRTAAGDFEKFGSGLKTFAEGARWCASASGVSPARQDPGSSEGEPCSTADHGRCDQRRVHMVQSFALPVYSRARCQRMAIRNRPLVGTARCYSSPGRWEARLCGCGGALRFGDEPVPSFGRLNGFACLGGVGGLTRGRNMGSGGGTALMRTCLTPHRRDARSW